MSSSLQLTNVVSSPNCRVDFSSDGNQPESLLFQLPPELLEIILKNVVSGRSYEDAVDSAVLGCVCIAAHNWVHPCFIKTFYCSPDFCGHTDRLVHEHSPETLSPLLKRINDRAEDLYTSLNDSDDDDDFNLNGVEMEFLISGGEKGDNPKLLSAVFIQMLNLHPMTEQKGFDVLVVCKERYLTDEEEQNVFENKVTSHLAKGSNFI